MTILCFVSCGSLADVYTTCQLISCIDAREWWGGFSWLGHESHKWEYLKIWKTMALHVPSLLANSIERDSQRCAIWIRLPSNSNIADVQSHSCNLRHVVSILIPLGKVPTIIVPNKFHRSSPRQFPIKTAIYWGVVLHFIHTIIFLKKWMVYGDSSFKITKGWVWRSPFHDFHFLFGGVLSHGGTFKSKSFSIETTMVTRVFLF